MKTRNQRKRCIHEIVAKTGRTDKEVAAMADEAVKRLGISYRDYVRYKYYLVPIKEQEKVFLIKHSRKLIAKYDVNREFAYISTNKAKTNKYFAEYLNRQWCINTEISFDEFSSIFNNTAKIIYKPIAGNRGIYYAELVPEWEKEKDITIFKKRKSVKIDVTKYERE